MNIPVGYNQQVGIVELEVPSHLIIVGANGSGKSRFAAAIENNLKDNQKPVLRISAQRAVSIPDFTKLRALDEAIRDVQEGQNYLMEYTHGIGKAARTDREQNLLRVLSDFEPVLGLLFARSAKIYKNYFQQGGEKSKTPIEKIKQAWSSLLPERELWFDEDKMTISVRNYATYAEHHASKMSDGERTVLYLLAQCLSADENSVIIIDEPELHLHKSIVSALFSNLQLDRPDCLFVYITHDLEFAAGQPNAKKIWLKGYHGNSWTWELVPETDALPERLLLEVLGARKPVLLVEGGSTSDDKKVYDILFPKMTVISCGSCDQVIKSVAVLRQKYELTHINPLGLIDRDYRSQQELEVLAGKGVYSLHVAEIESLFLTEEVINLLAKEFSSGLIRVENAKEYIKKTFEEQLNRQIADSANFNIRSELVRFARPSEEGKDNFVEKYQAHINEINPEVTYNVSQALFEAAKNSGNLKNILRVFNMKRLRGGVAGALGVKSDMYQEKTMMLLKDEKISAMKNAFREYVPAELHQYMAESSSQQVVATVNGST